jgi:hypothetical protein
MYIRSKECEACLRIYDNLIIQPASFVYPAVVKDLWQPNHMAWNVELIHSQLMPGQYTSKSAYKHCFANKPTTKGCNPTDYFSS